MKFVKRVILICLLLLSIFYLPGRASFAATIPEYIEDVGTNMATLWNCGEKWETGYGLLLVIQEQVMPDTTLYFVMGGGRSYTMIEVELPGNVCDQYVEGFIWFPYMEEPERIFYHQKVHRDEYITDENNCSGPWIEKLEPVEIWRDVFDYLLKGCHEKGY